MRLQPGLEMQGHCASHHRREGEALQTAGAEGGGAGGAKLLGHSQSTSFSLTPHVFWGFFARTVWTWHVTWAVNSVSHVWGFQDWNTGDISMNNWLVGILAFGEGWHNNHHAFETSCRHGLKWWQIDMTWYTIKALEFFGLAWDLKYPSEAKKRKLSWDQEPGTAGAALA
ncbi:ADS3 [Symbiodinium microadriaticum]|nr:ADS3 [Symbiodinium microadriaticum]